MILHDFNKLLNDPKLNDLEVISNYQKLHALLVKKFSYNIAFPIISELIGPNNIWLEDWDDEFNIFMKTIFVLLPCKNKIDLNIKEEKKSVLDVLLLDPFMIVTNTVQMRISLTTMKLLY